MNKKYIVLLRGVMPTGKNKVPMAKLRAILIKSGFNNVQTYIQSGNILLESAKSPEVISALIHDEIAKHFGGDIAVITITPSTLSRIVVQNPFPATDPANMYYVFLASTPERDAIESLMQQDLTPTKWAQGHDVIYMYCPQTYSKSKMNNNFIEKKLKVAASTRNHNTTSKLVHLSAQ